MVLPIIAALSRDLFLTVPVELKDGAAALGATRWEIIRGVVLPTTVRGGGRHGARARARARRGDRRHADDRRRHRHPRSLFLPGNSLASRIATEFNSPESKLHIPSLFYLALILLVIGLVTSLLARTIASRFDVRGAGAMSVCDAAWAGAARLDPPRR